jgi:uncharacterized protein
MNASARLVCIVATAILGACASSPPAHYVTLDDGHPSAAKLLTAPSVAVICANVPDLIDRPQLVVRTNGNQLAISEQYRWAEPLRREIPRVIANDLGELLDSNQVAALPAGAEGFNVDFKLVLDVQRLDAVAGQGADVDVLWRLEHRSGTSAIGRSSFRQPLDGAAADYRVLIVAQRRALRRVAAEIAKEIVVYPEKFAGIRAKNSARF